jgi:predicted Zn-dependent protease
VRLADAAASAAGLLDDARTARVATELIRRRAAAPSAVDLTSVFSAVVRRAMSRNDVDEALNSIEQATEIADDETSGKLDVWRAEILARDGRPGDALRIYQGLLRPDATGAALALDAAETMLDNGHHDQAEPLLQTARELAHRTGRQSIERRARQLLDRLP